MSEFIYLAEQDVVDMVGLAEAIPALERMLRDQAREQARNVPKTLATWGEGGSMHALGSLMPERGYLGFKTWAHTKAGGAAVFTLFDSHSGNLLAIIEARALGQLRTSGMSGVATRLMADPHASAMALVGTGAQAMLQLAAVAAVRPLASVKVFSPTAEKRKAFVQRAAELFGFVVREAASVEEAVEGAGIVTLITRAKEPFLQARMLAPGAHLNAVGAILPANAEFDQDLFDAADLVVVDDLENAKRGSRELQQRYGAEPQAWSAVQTLAQCIDRSPSRGSGLSIFKGMGMGLSDLALASAAYERARETGRGRAMPHPARVNPVDALRQTARP